MKSKVAFLGLGVMGFPLAGHLAGNGYEVTVYNRTASRAAQWLEKFCGAAGATPAEAVQDAETIFTCVGRDDDLREICYGKDGALGAMRSGAVLVDHTTASAAVAREIADACATRGAYFIDAPVSGGQQGAEDGRLSVMCGGELAIYERIRPMLESYAHAVALLGPVGSGQLCKMVNQICIAGIVQGLAEGLHFARQAGLDAEQVVGVIAKGAAQSWQMENRHATMLAGHYEHGFAVDWMRKDLDIVLAEAKKNGARLPVTALVDQFYADVQANGGGRWDTSSLFTRLTDQPVKP